MNDLDPLPLGDVLAIVDRRARRRQRLALGATLGVGAVAAAAIGTAAIDRGPEPTDVVADGGAATVAPTGPTSTSVAPPAALAPSWQNNAAAHAVDVVGFEYDDALALSEQWQVDPFTTKVVVGEALRVGAPPEVDQLVAGVADPVVANEVLDELIDAFWSAGYDIGDAEEHGGRWGTAAFDSKLLIGVRVANDLPVED